MTRDPGHHNLTLRQLSVFVSVAETGSTTGAAQNLSMSQSAVSSALSELEKALAEQLFDRRGRKLRLNDLGRLLLPRVRTLFQQVDGIINAGRDGGGMLRIAASTTISNYILPPFLARYHKNLATGDSGGKVTLLTGNTQEVLDSVRNCDADAGLIEGSCSVDDFLVEHWMDDECWWWPGRNTLWQRREPPPRKPCAERTGSCGSAVPARGKCWIPK